MSTTYTGSAVKNTASGATITWRAKLVYTETVSATSVSIRCQCYMSVNSGQAPWFNKNRITGTLTIAGSTAKSYSGPSSDKTTFKNDVSLIDYSTSYARTTTAQTKACSCKITVSSYSSWKGTSTATITNGINIPALEHHNINYNGNGAESGTVETTIKYYNIDVPLSNGSTLIRDNYSLTQWNTASDGSGTPYTLGQIFTNNLTQDITLYAQWLLNYTAPSIDEGTLNIYRVDANDNASEEGERIYIEFDYTGGFETEQNLEKPNIEIIIDDVNIYGPTLQTTAVGTFHQIFGTYNITGKGTYANNESHTIIINLFDEKSNVSYTQSITSATYPIDLLVDNTTHQVYMGIMTAAVNQQPLTFGKRGIAPDMTAQEVSDFVDSLNVGGGGVAVDLVVEEGSLSGGLDGSSNYYRKWNSGRAEFWYRRYKNDGLTTAAWSSPIYYVDISAVYASIWQGVFTVAPTQVLVESNFSQIISMIPMAWDANGITGLRFVTIGAKSNSAYGFSVHATGRWK